MNPFKNKTMENTELIKGLHQRVIDLERKLRDESMIRKGLAEEIAGNLISITYSHIPTNWRIRPEFKIDGCTFYFNDLQNLEDLREYIRIRISEIEMEVKQERELANGGL